MPDLTARPLRSLLLATAAAGLTFGVGADAARADSRAFTFSYETTTMPPGQVEYEQWVTWKTEKAEDESFDELEFRHELEFGITDRWQVALYFADWNYKDGDSVDDDGAEFEDVAFETIYQLTNPTTDALGSALYGEVKFGDEVLALEGKLLLEKQLGQWIAVWNGIVEAEWEGSHYDEDKGEFGQTLGLSYQINPNWRVGGELIHEIEYEDWSEWGDHVVYAGPNVSYRTDAWWVTLTPTYQLTDVDSEANFVTRLIFGVNF